MRTKYLLSVQLIVCLLHIDFLLVCTEQKNPKKPIRQHTVANYQWTATKLLVAFSVNLICSKKYGRYGSMYKSIRFTIFFNCGYILLTIFGHCMHYAEQFLSVGIEMNYLHELHALSSVSCCIFFFTVKAFLSLKF